MSSKSKSLFFFSIAILVLSIGLNVYLLSKLNIRNKDMETMQKTISEQKYYPKYSYDEEQQKIAEALDEYQSGLYPNKKLFLTEVLSALPVWVENDINNSNYKMDQKKINKVKAEQREILIRVIRASNEYKLTGEIKDKEALSYVSDKKRQERGWIPQKLLFEEYDSDNYMFCYKIEPVSPEDSMWDNDNKYGFCYYVHYFYDTKKANGPNREGLLQYDIIIVDKVDGKWMVVDYVTTNTEKIESIIYDYFDIKLKSLQQGEVIDFSHLFNLEDKKSEDTYNFEHSLLEYEIKADEFLGNHLDRYELELDFRNIEFEENLVYAEVREEKTYYYQKTGGRANKQVEYHILTLKAEDDGIYIIEDESDNEAILDEHGNKIDFSERIRNMEAEAKKAEMMYQENQ